MKETKPKLPPALINMLNEHTGGCFFVFYVDDLGNPDFIFHTDSPMMREGFVTSMAATVGALQTENELSNEIWHRESLSRRGIESFDHDEILDDDEGDDRRVFRSQGED